VVKIIIFSLLNYLDVFLSVIDSQIFNDKLIFGNLYIYSAPNWHFVNSDKLNLKISGFFDFGLRSQNLNSRKLVRLIWLNKYILRRFSNKV
jgi:hypothetical protein